MANLSRTPAVKVNSAGVTFRNNTFKTKPYIAPSRSTTPDALTAKGGRGFSRTPEAELFLLAVSNFVSEESFHESAGSRDTRFASLVAQVTKSNPAFVADFVPFLRDTLNMRTASVVMAAEYVKAGGSNGRQVVASAIVRADEPAELLAYWTKNHGRAIPQPIKRGVADAIQRVYSERSVLKYDSKDATFRMADAIELVHPRPKAPWQSELFKYALDRRHNRDGSYELLKLINQRDELFAMPVERRRAFLAEEGAADRLAEAGVTWEALSGWLHGPMDAVAWEAIIPSMGYMALLRNLRNFSEAGIGQSARALVLHKLTSEEEVAKSRQLPLRFYSAYKNVTDSEYRSALEEAVRYTLQNIPSLDGSTLVMVDTSASMNSPWSKYGKATYKEVAALFGAALALRNDHANLVSFDSDNRVHNTRGKTLLGLVSEIIKHSGGTNTWQAFNKHNNGQDRSVIITDEQADYGSPRNVEEPIYTFNIGGYRVGHSASGVGTNRVTIGGLSDNAFKAVALLEAQRQSADSWEFLKAA